MSAILQRVDIAEKSGVTPAHTKWLFWCPGCNEMHGFQTGHPTGPNWWFDGDDRRPTFTPSLLVRGGHYAGHDVKTCWCAYGSIYGNKPPFACARCHSFVTDGKIQFLDDCSHALAGRVVDMVEIPEGMEW